MTSRPDQRVWLLLLLAAAAGCVGLVVLLVNGGGAASTADPQAGAGAAPRGAGNGESGAPPRAAPRVVVPPTEAVAPPDAPPELPEPSAEEPEPGPPPRPPDAELAPAELVIELIEEPTRPERTITARVRDSFGDPIPGALVVVRLGTALLYRERTDADGVAVYAPYDWEEGPFRIDALAFGYVTATAPEVAPGADIDLVMKARSIIEGEVVGPAEGLGVVRLLTSEGELETPVEADNTFRFANLDEGYVTVRAEIDPYGAAQESFYLEGGVLRYVKLKLDVDNHVRVAGELAPWPGDGRCFINGHSVAVGALGEFEFERAVAGVNEIFVDAPGRALFRERFNVAGRGDNHLGFRLLKEARVKGRAIDADTRRPLEGAQVRLGVEFGDPVNDRVPLFPIERVPIVKTDDRGRFEIERLDPRLAYLVSVVAHGYGQAIERVVPAPGVVRIEVPPGPFLFGRLRGLGGVPRDAVVQALRLQEVPTSRRFNVDNWDGSRSGRDNDGFYGLDGLIPGLYHLRVEAPGFGSVETVVDLLDGRRARLDLRLRRGLDLAEQDLELLRRLPPAVAREPEDSPPADVTVLHVDARRPPDQPPLPGVLVRFFENEAEFTAPMLYSLLEFELYGLPEGDYRAILTHPTLAKPVVVDNLRLRRGEPLPVKLFR